MDEGNKPLCTKGTLTGGLIGSIEGTASLYPKWWIIKLRESWFDIVSKGYTLWRMVEYLWDRFFTSSESQLKT